MRIGHSDASLAESVAFIEWILKTADPSHCDAENRLQALPFDSLHQAALSLGRYMSVCFDAIGKPIRVAGSDFKSEKVGDALRTK